MTEKDITGIVVTHGKLGEELLSTVSLIVGEIHDCYALSGSDLSDESVSRSIREIIDRNKAKRALVFVDYFGGSCGTSCVKATRGLEGVKVISGVNLPMMLDFVTKQGTMDFDEIVDHLIHRGQESVRVIDF
jgi:mannose/fructose-specific phosphotransferase system component IIA